MKTRIIVTLTILVLFSPGMPAQGEEQLSVMEIIKRSHDAFFYAGADMKANIEMKLINKRGKTRKRRMTMLRMNAGDSGNQKFYIYFHEPADVRDMAFLVWKYPGKDDDRWLYISAIKLVKRIAASDQFSSFVGSDFTYEDISGRDIEADEHRLVETGELDGKKVYVVESLPKLPASFTKKVSWIEKETFLPIKEEYYNLRGEVFKVFKAEAMETINGIPTITKSSMKNVKRQHTTEVVYLKTSYNIGLKESVFTERSLRNPPKRWIR